jgi:hypothetical protein
MTPLPLDDFRTFEVCTETFAALLSRFELSDQEREAILAANQGEDDDEAPVATS